MKRRKGNFRREKRLRAIARERVGAVKPARVMEPKTKRKKPKQPGRWNEDLA